MSERRKTRVLRMIQDWDTGEKTYIDSTRAVPQSEVVHHARLV